MLRIAPTAIRQGRTVTSAPRRDPVNSAGFPQRRRLASGLGSPENIPLSGRQAEDAAHQAPSVQITFLRRLAADLHEPARQLLSDLQSLPEEVGIEKRRRHVLGPPSIEGNVLTAGSVVRVLIGELIGLCGEPADPTVDARTGSHSRRFAKSADFPAASENSLPRSSCPNHSIRGLFSWPDSQSL